MAQQIPSPTHFSFEHSGGDVVKFRLHIVDGPSGDELTGVDIPVGDPGLMKIGDVYSGALADYSIGIIQIGADHPVRLTVRAFDADNHGSSPIYSSTEFSFTYTEVPDAPTDIEVS
jgi:hypothetical protein